MNGEEARVALKTRQKIRFGGALYDYAQAWRVSIDRQSGDYIQSLELVKNNTVVCARIEDCELTEKTSRYMKWFAQSPILSAENAEAEDGR